MTAQETLPELLYHGSGFHQQELMPGFKRTGKLVKWDGTESNLFLYTTSVKDTAIELGFASSIEKAFDISRFHVLGNKIEIETEEALTIKDLLAVPVYLYTIQYQDEDGWEKNSNAQNGLATEFKTKETVRSINSCDKIDVKTFLDQYQVSIRKTLRVGMGHGKEVTMESAVPAWVKW